MLCLVRLRVRIRVRLRVRVRVRVKAPRGARMFCLAAGEELSEQYGMLNLILTLTLTAGEELAKQYGMRFFETSARSNLQVSEAFETLATDVVDRLLAAQGEAQDKGVSVDPPSSRSSQCC